MQTRYSVPSFEGITIGINNHRGETLKLGAENSVGRITVQNSRYDPYTLWVEIADRVDATCFAIENHPNMPGNKIVRPMPPMVGINFARFEQTVPVIRLGKNWGWMTKYSSDPRDHQNNLHIGRRVGTMFEDWTVSFVGQEDIGFLPVSLGYRAQVYRQSDGKLVCPELTKRFDLDTVLDRLFWGEDRNSVPSVEEYRAPPAKPTPQLKEGEGVVVWWNPSQQKGMIRVMWEGTLQEVNAHWSKIATKRESFLHLIEGEVVTVKGLEPVTGMKFTHQAVGILPHSDFSSTETPRIET